MGCASSTPMVATAGSDILKSATHVASDAVKGAENAVEDVAGTVGKTIEDAKETVGTAVTGIAHDLSNALNEKTSELDTAKNQLLERLHLGGAETTEGTTADKTDKNSANHLDTKALEEAARLPTPPPDLDTLSTTTTEPEIAEAFANSPDFISAAPTKPTNADLEKLNEKVKQAMQTNPAGAAEAANGITTERKHALTGEPIGSIAATEPVADLVALLAAEKRPNTTEWEKHADRLSKTRKRNAFKGGGGKFRRFGPVTSQMLPIHPANYIQPIEAMKSSLLDDDSCYSDVYYNSRSSSPQSTRSNSPGLRRARLPATSVLNMNAKYMQRELAALLHDRRRSTEHALRSLMVSPALGRQFDYNPQRTRYASPTPSVMGLTTRSTFTPPLVLEAELPPLQRAANWKRNRETSNINLLQPPQLVPPIRANTPQLTSNVISQPKITSTKAFAPLRAQKSTNGRTMQFGYTRTGSPVNRRVFAKRSGLPTTNKVRAFPVRSDSPERTRELIQERIETAKRERNQLAQQPAIIKLEREASIKENEVPSLGEMAANGFSLSRALSPIKMAAETHSLTHLKGMEHKSASSRQSLLEVVEQAVERSKSGELSTESDVRSGKAVEVVSTQVSKREEKSSAEKKKESSRGDDGIIKNDRKTGKEKHVINPNASSISSNKKMATPVSKNSKKQSTKSNEISRKNDSATSSSSTHKDDIIMGNLGRPGVSLSKQKNLKNSSNEKGRSQWKHSDSGERDSAVRSATRDNLKGIEKVVDSNTQLDQKSDNFETGRGRNNHNNGWRSSQSRDSEIRYTNISNRFELPAATSFINKKIARSPEVNHESSRSSILVIDDGAASSNEAEEFDHNQDNDYDSNGSHTEDYDSSPQSRYNQTHESGWKEQDQDQDHERDNESTSEHSSEEEEVKPRHSADLRKPHGHQKSKSPTTNIEKDLTQVSSKPSQTLVDHQPTKDNQNNNSNIAEHSSKTNSPNHHPRKYTTQPNSQVPNSLNSSPSKSSKSSTSIIIRTILNTPETEYSYEVVASPKRLHEQRFETIAEVNFSHTSTEEGSQSDLAETSEPSLVSSPSEEEEEEEAQKEHTSSTASLHSSHKDINIYVAPSIEEMLNMLPHDTAYLKLGRSATTFALRSTSPILDAQSHSYRSTPRRYKRHSACDNHHVEQVPFVRELSSVSPSRLPFVPSPYRMRSRCPVCYNKYVIK